MPTIIFYSIAQFLWEQQAADENILLVPGTVHNPAIHHIITLSKMSNSSVEILSSPVN